MDFALACTLVPVRVLFRFECNRLLCCVCVFFFACGINKQVMEETGYDASKGANDKDFLTLYLNSQQTTMYIVSGVDEDFAFEPQVRA